MKRLLPIRSFKLNGPDNFLLALDHMMVRECGNSNICSLEFSVGSSRTADEWADLIRAFSLFHELAALRLRGGFLFGQPRWEDAGGTACAITVMHGDVVVRRKIDPRKEAPIAFDLFSSEEGVQVVFVWHHALMDAHGAEALLAAFGSADREALTSDRVWTATTISDVFKDISNTLEMKDFLADAAREPLGKMTVDKSMGQDTGYKVVSFTDEETKRIDGRASTHGALINKSAFYLASCGLAFSECLNEGVGRQGDLLVPIPQDRRKRGVTAPLISNQVTFLFYRLAVQAHPTLKDMVGAIGRQTMDMMRDGVPDRFFKMMELSRYIPQFAYQRLIRSPAQGQMASFFFSDTGDSLGQFTDLSGCPVDRIVHYPPNVIPPGLSIIFSRPQNRLQYTVAYLEQTWTPDRLNAFVQTLNEYLAGKDTSV